MAVDSTAEGSAASPKNRAASNATGDSTPDVANQDGSAEREPPADSIVGTADDGIVRQLGHDDFDPVGTLVLILIYFVILVVMWVFMYFFEYLGRGLTVVG